MDVTGHHLDSLGDQLVAVLAAHAGVAVDDVLDQSLEGRLGLFFDLAASLVACLSLLALGGSLAFDSRLIAGTQAPTVPLLEASVQLAHHRLSHALATVLLLLVGHHLPELTLDRRQRIKDAEAPLLSPLVHLDTLEHRVPQLGQLGLDVGVGVRELIHAAVESLTVGHRVAIAIRSHLALTGPAAPSEGLEVEDEVRPAAVVQRVVAEGALVRLEPGIGLLRAQARELPQQAQVTREGAGGCLGFLRHALLLLVLEASEELGHRGRQRLEHLGPLKPAVVDSVRIRHQLRLVVGVHRGGSGPKPRYTKVQLDLRACH